jgi:phage shock protein C
MVTGMNNEISGSAPAKGLRRPIDGRVLGGVCAAVARSLRVEPILVRLAVVALALASGGSVGLVYLLAWALIPPETVGTATPDDTGSHASRDAESPARSVDDGAGPTVGPTSARAAWSTAGTELRALARELRPTPAPAGGRSPVDAVDSVLTGVGERLRGGAVQESARRTAAQLAAAVTASAEAVNQGTRRRTGAAAAPHEDPTGH